MTQVILVTGATDGLGRSVAEHLASRGARLLLHARTRQRGLRSAAEIRKATGGPLPRVLVADFRRLDEVHAAAEALMREEEQLDAVVSNAGIGLHDHRELTGDGLESTWQINFVAGALLVQRLLPLLRRARDGRVVSVSSSLQWAIDVADPDLCRGWSPERAYGQSKLAQVAWTLAHSRREGTDGVAFRALHPASCMPTKLVLGKFAVRSSIEEGVRNVLALCLGPRNVSSYHENGVPASPGPQASQEWLGELLLDFVDNLASRTGSPGQCWRHARERRERATS